MLDIIAADDEKPLARPDHQSLNHRQSFLFDGAGDARYAPFARRKTRGADQGENQEEGADIAQNFECHFIPFRVAATRDQQNPSASRWSPKRSWDHSKQVATLIVR